MTGEIRVDGRLLLTTAQAAERRGCTPRTFASWASRHGITPADRVDPRTPLWRPEDVERGSPA